MSTETKAVAATPGMDQLKTQLSALPQSDRVELAVYLLDSLEPADERVEEAWQEEVGRRIEEIRNGTVVGRDTDELIAELERRYP